MSNEARKRPRERAGLGEKIEDCHPLVKAIRKLPDGVRDAIRCPHNLVISVLGNDGARSSPSPLRGTPPVLRGRVRSGAKREPRERGRCPAGTEGAISRTLHRLFKEPVSHSTRDGTAKACHKNECFQLREPQRLQRRRKGRSVRCLWLPLPGALLPVLCNDGAS